MIDPRLSWRDWWNAIKAVFGDMDEMNLGLISAGVAFYSMLAMFPAVAAIIAVWGFFANPSEVAEQIEILRAFVPAEAFTIIDTQVHALASANSSALGWTTLVSTGAAVWSSRLGVEAMIRGLNAIYRQKNRAGLRQYAAAFGVTFLLMGVALVALGSVVILPILLAIVPLGPLAGLAVAAARWILATTIVVAALGVIYRYGPNRRGARVAWLTPGAVIAVVIWGAASYAFSFYLSNFGNYNEIYGALGAVIALLMWLFISAFAVLLGAALNAQLELRTRRDTTVGRERPMGERGAVVADRLSPDAVTDK